MFTHHCTACERTQLISFTMAATYEKTADAGLRVEFTCWCGAEQTHVLAPFVDAEPAHV